MRPRGRTFKKAPTNRTESVEALVERPVCPTKPCQPTETNFAQSPNVSKLAEILCLGLFFIIAETSHQFQTPVEQRWNPLFYKASLMPT